MNQTLFDKIETYFVVTVIAMLIWLWAEGENVTTAEVGVRVQFEAAPGQNLHIESPEIPGGVRVQFNCATSQMAQVTNLGPIVIPVSTDTNPTVILAERLTAEFAAAGASIIKTVPPTFELKIESMDSRMLPVKEEAGGLALKDVHFDPAEAEVKVTGPASMIQLLDGVTLLVPVGDVAVVPVVPADARPQTHTVRVRLPDGYDAANLTFDPQMVQVTFTIDTLEDTKDLEGVGIHFEFAGEGFNNYIVKTADPQTLLAEPVTVTGPRDIIQELTNKNVTAILFLTNQELESGDGVKELIFRTPPGVVVQSLHPLNYTVKRRETPQ